MPHINDFTGKRAHMIGIGGSSMNGLALMLKQKGVIVTGSDSAESYMTEALRQQGIDLVIGHFSNSVHGADLVIYSAAISAENPERAEAARLGIPQMERAELLGQLMEGAHHLHHRLERQDDDHLHDRHGTHGHRRQSDRAHRRPA